MAETRVLDMGACWACRTSSFVWTATASWVTVKRCKMWVALELASSLRRVELPEVSSAYLDGQRR